VKVESKGDERTGIDEKGKGNAEMMKKRRNEALLLSLLILNCTHEI
jgi:hypothetical protein